MILLYGAIVFVVQILFSFLPSAKYWGAHHYAILSPPWFAAGLAATVLLYVVISRLAPGTRPPPPGVILPVGLIAAGIIFWLGRGRTPLLGDGQLWMAGIREGGVLWLNEPASLWFLYGVNRAAGRPDPAITTSAVSIACGIVYVAISVWFARTRSRDMASFLIIAGLLCLAGVTRLFYGYLETYPILAVAVLAYLVLSLEACRGTIHPGWAAALVFLVPAFHTTGLALLPSAGYLLWTDARDGSRGRRVFWGGVAGLASLVVGLILLSGRAIVDLYAPFAAKLLPLTGPGTDRIPYAFLSLTHGRDVAQEHLLAGPFAALFVLIVLVTRPLLDRPSRFLLWAGVPWLILSLVFNRELGAARDWDLFAVASLPFLLLAGLILTRDDGLRRAPGRLSAVAALIISISAFHLFPWIVSGARESRSVRHFELVFDRSAAVAPFARSYAFETLAEFRLARGDREEAIAAYRKAFSADATRWRAVSNLGHLLYESGRIEEAAATLREAVAHHPDNAALAMNLAACLRALGKIDEALASYRRAVDLDPRFLEAHLAYAELLQQTARADEAEEILRDIDSRFPANPDVHFLLGRVLTARGRLEEAIRAYTICLERRPASARRSEISLLLADLYMRTGQSDPARDMLLRLLAADSTSRYAVEAKRILAR